MKQTTVIYLSLLLTLPASLASAAQVFTWIDAAGITHFSESPPADPATDTQVVDIQPPPASANAPAGDFYSVINQADRMERNRLANEKLAAEKQQADAEASKARAEATALQQGAYNNSGNEDYRYYPVYPYYPRYGHHPGRPGHGNKPVHPVYPRPKNPRTSLGKTPGMPGQTGSWR